MTKLTPQLLEAFNRLVKPLVLTTTATDGTPNSIYASSVALFEETIVIADNYFNKTRANIVAGGKASILFITNDKKAYQLKGRLTYHTSGPVYDDMKKWNMPQHPGLAAVTMEIEEAYSGAERLI